MNFPILLEVAIGLIFTYLILSLLASEIQEVLTTLLQWRAAHLKKSIEILLTGERETNTGTTQDDRERVKKLVQDIYEHPLLKNISQHTRGGIESVLRQVVRSIITIGRPPEKRTLRNGTEPSYIPAETFASTLLEKLNLSQFSHQLTALNLQIFVEQEMLSEIKIYLDSLDATTSLELQNDLSDLDRIFKNIATAFKEQKATLLTSVYRLRDSLDGFINRVQSRLSMLHETADSPDFDPVNSSDISHAALQTFVDQLTNLKQSLFYEGTANYTNTDEVVRRLQPGLDQVLSFFIDEVEDVRKKYRRINPNSSIFQIYEEIRNNANQIAQELPRPVQDSLAALARRAQINLERSKERVDTIEAELKQFQVEIETWFDRSMERSSGVYKRNAKGVAFLVGVAIACVANADTFHIVSRLAIDPAVRTAVVEAAESATQCPASLADTSVDTSNSTQLGFHPLEQGAIAQEAPLENAPPPVETPSPETPAPAPLAPVQAAPAVEPSPQLVPATPPSKLDCIRETVNETVPLPVGWDRYNVSQQLKESNISRTADSQDLWRNLTPRMILGWLISGFAISMGAPFWFDLLGKVVNVRNSGTRTDKK